MFKDRQGNIQTKDATPEKALWALYKTVPGRQLLKILINPTFSDLIRAYMKSPFSALRIDSFVKKNNISLKDYVPTKYKSFNDFFTRKIKDGRRPFVSDPAALPSPCDCRASVYTISEDLVLDIKGSKYTVQSLLRNGELAQQYAGGYCMILRLTVDDYHRYCYPDDGYKTDDVFLPGILHTVNPIALDFADIYTENQRMYTTLHSAHFGPIVQMEVGAMGVGRIVNHRGEGIVRRGEEKGYFEFGGSTIVLLLRKNCFTPDEDIVRNTAEGYETMVRQGEQIGYNEKYKG